MADNHHQEQKYRPNWIEITDLSLPGPDVFAHLTEAQLRNRLEPEKGIFIAQTPKVIELALNAGCKPVSFLVEKKQPSEQVQHLLNRCGEVPVYTAESSLLKSLTGFALTRGVLCALRRPLLALPQDLCSGARRVAVLENIVDSTNIGAVFRSAAALGMDAVLVTPSCCDPLNRRAVRVSMGTVFQVPWAYLGNCPEDWPHSGLKLLHSLGFKTVALALNDTALSLEDAALASQPKLALVLGTEGDGLCAETVAGCDYTARIPMAHGVDSLNVAAAAAVAFWQLRVKD